MDFDLNVNIERSPYIVFAFLRDKDTYPQEDNSPVLLLERTTTDPLGVGTRYREIVQMLPIYKGEILSEITHYEPGRRLDEDWQGPCMDGSLTYLFLPENGGTKLIQREIVNLCGLLWLFSPIVKLTLGMALRKRLNDIKRILESGWNPIESS
jgi:hypothetical protein